MMLLCTRCGYEQPEGHLCPGLGGVGVKDAEILQRLSDPPQHNPRTPYRCPVCNGNGLVTNGFYGGPSGSYISEINGAPDTCRSCGGTGVVWSP